MGWFQTKDAPEPPGGTITTWIRREQTAKGTGSRKYTVKGDVNSVTIDNGSGSMYVGLVVISRQDLPIVVAMLKHEMESPP